MRFPFLGKTGSDRKEFAMAQLKVRKFREQDAMQVSRVMITAFKTFLKEKFTKDDEERFSPSFWRRTGQAKDKFSQTVSFVVVDGKKVVGYMKAVANRNGLGSLDVVGVNPEYFGKGVGKLLIQNGEKFWKSKNMRKISTCVSAHNKRALLYYIKNGFVPEGYRRDHFEKGVDEIILGKFIKQ